MKPIKIAQIGVEHDHGGMVLQSIRKQTELFDVVGYAEPNESLDASFGNFCFAKDLPRMSVEEIFEIPGLEAVTVECREKDLSKYAKLAAEHGLPLHMDKPGGDVPQEFDEMLDLMESKNLLFHTGYMYRYNPAVRRALELAKSGKLGEIYSIEAHMDCFHNKEKREWLGQYKGGMMFFLGCHLIDLILLFLGEPERILPFNRATGIDGVGSEDLGLALLEYKNGISFAKSCASEVNGFERRQLVICGSKGTVEIKPLEHLLSGTADITTYMSEAFAEDAIASGWHQCRKDVTFPAYNRYDAMMADFAHTLRGEKQNDYPAEYERLAYHCAMRACAIE